jgi:hypothetical protein
VPGGSLVCSGCGWTDWGAIAVVSVSAALLAAGFVFIRPGFLRWLLLGAAALFAYAAIGQIVKSVGISRRTSSVAPVGDTTGAVRPFGSKEADSLQPTEAPSASGQDAPGMQSVEDVVAALRNTRPRNPVCWVVLFGDRPLTANLSGEGNVLCFTQGNKAETFMARYQDIYHCEQPLSALAVGDLAEVWAMMHNASRDTLYESDKPFGLIIDFDYGGQPYSRYGVADLKRHGLSGLKRGFEGIAR